MDCNIRKNGDNGVSVKSRICMCFIYAPILYAKTALLLRTLGEIIGQRKVILLRISVELQNVGTGEHDQRI